MGNKRDDGEIFWQTALVCVAIALILAGATFFLITDEGLGYWLVNQ